MTWDGKPRRAIDRDSRGMAEILLDMEKRQVSNQEQLKHINERLDRHSKYYEDMTNRIEKSLDGFRILIIGDGKEKGLAERVRGLEGWVNHIKAIWIAILGVATKIGSDFISYLWNKQ